MERCCSHLPRLESPQWPIRDHDEGSASWTGDGEAEAKVQNRQAYLLVYFASKEVLPLWVFPEAVGGRADDHCLEQGFDSEADIKSLAKLGAALRGATGASRFFRSLGQWLAA